MKTWMAYFLFAAVTFGGIAAMKMVDDYRCAETWSGSGFRTRINFGCQVEVDGRWLPAENVKIITATSVPR